MTKVTINLDTHANWELDLQEIIDQFPEEYKADKEEGLDDYQFVVRTFDSMGERYFEDVFGYPLMIQDLEIEVY